MIKVMVVDDEYLIRIGIKSTISWEENGFLIVGDASNGEEALKLYHELLPDIVITDIKMPRMDGLELTKCLKALNPEVKIVILSSHNDFIFAKEALTLGASDYILKATMEPSEILNTLVGIKQQIVNKQTEIKKINLLQNDLEQHKQLIKHKVFSEFLKGKLEPINDNLAYLRGLDINFPYSDFVVICGRIDDFEEQYRKVNPVTRRLLRDSIQNIYLSKMNEYYRGAVEELTDGVFVCVLSVCKAKYSCEDAGILYGTAVQEAVKAYTSVTISISISRGIHEFSNILEGVEETLSFLRYKIFYGKNSLLPYKQIVQHNQKMNNPISCEEDKIRYFLLDGQSDQVELLVKSVFKNVCKESCSFIILNYICTQYISILNRISIEVGFSRELEKTYFAAEEPLGLESVIEIERWFQNQFKLLSQSINFNKRNCGSGLIREAMKYIRCEYMNNITLGDVAEHVNISRIYFSQLFKQETGEKYIDFLIKVRIEKAKEYLSFHDLKTYEVAEKVGFQDSGYFARMFKKCVGKTPSEFQKGL